MISRREFMAGSAVIVASSSVLRSLTAEPESIPVNDVHSQLNATRVLGIVQPESLEDVQSIVHTVRRDRKPIAVAGGRHAMGGFQAGSFDIELVPTYRIS